jgi:hypothetical protein
MEQERNFVRLQKGGTHMLIEAAQMGKAAAPKIMLIFNEANESDYSFALGVLTTITILRLVRSLSYCASPPASDSDSPLSCPPVVGWIV